MAQMGRQNEGAWEVSWLAHVLIATMKMKKGILLTKDTSKHSPHATTSSELTFPISDAQEMEIWFGTADDKRTRDVIFKGRPGRFCSIPFLGGGAYPCSRKAWRRGGGNVSVKFCELFLLSLPNSGQKNTHTDVQDECKVWEKLLRGVKDMKVCITWKYPFSSRNICRSIIMVLFLLVAPWRQKPDLSIKTG